MFSHPSIGTAVRVSDTVRGELRGKVVTIVSYRAPSWRIPVMRARVREIMDSGDLGPERFIVPSQLQPL